MHAQAEKAKEQTSRIAANSVAQKKSGMKQCIGFVDNPTKWLTQAKRAKELAIPNRYLVSRQLYTKQQTAQLLHASFANASYVGANGAGLGAAAAASRVNGNTFAQVLRAGLVNDSGVPDSNADAMNQISNQAHHIVERSDANAAFSRMLLAGANIDLDSPINGVLLPSENHDDAIGVTRHSGSHTAAYAQRVNQSLAQAINAAPAPPGGWPLALGATAADQVYNALNGGTLFSLLQSTTLRSVLIARLQAIRQVLLGNCVPINSGVDEDYDPMTDDGITIDQIFTDNGI